MNNQPKMSEINFLEDKHYALYQKGKTKQTWDIGLDWGKLAMTISLMISKKTRSQ